MSIQPALKLSALLLYCSLALLLHERSANRRSYRDRRSELFQKRRHSQEQITYLQEVLLNPTSVLARDRDNPFLGAQGIYRARR